MRDSEERRFQIEEACKRAAFARPTCKAVLVPVFTRNDAETPDYLSLFTDDLSAVFILRDDQTVGMQVIIGTRVEKQRVELNQNGVIVGGTNVWNSPENMV